MTDPERNTADLPEDTLLPPDTRRSLPIALLRSREAVMARFRPVLAAHDISEQQWRVIRVLGETSPLDASEVAERACVLAPSLTRIIKALEERGMIHRLRDEGDGRRVLLSLSGSGAALIRAVTPESRAVYAELEQRFGARRMDQLLDLLGELAALK
jgi:homoprotocatechuate degradation regulator HpaR